MKKIAAFILAAAAMAVPVTAETAVNITVNGTPVEQKGVILDSRTMVPVRGVTEALGFVVDWDADTKTATFTNNGIVVKMTSGEKVFYVNDLPITPDVPQTIINDRFMLPLRAMCDSIGAKVDWDKDTKSAHITTVDIGNILSGRNKENADTAPADTTQTETSDKAPDSNTTIETGLPGVSIEIIDPNEVIDNITEIEL